MRKALVLFMVLGVALVFSGAVRAAEETAKEIKGMAGCASCCFKAEKCASAVKVGDTVYRLKASEKASEATQKLIASFADCKAAAVSVVITGVIADKVCIADAVVKVEEKKE